MREAVGGDGAYRADWMYIRDTGPRPAMFKDANLKSFACSSWSHDIFSPRCGRSDRYSVIFTADEMTVQNGIKKACLKFVGGHPEWSGHDAGIGNPVLMIFHDDSIPVPDIVPKALEHAYSSWL